MSVTRETLEHYLAVHNTAFENGDYAPVVELFHPEGELCFVGVELGPYRGREEIANAFREYPPSDQLVLSSIAADGNKATAIYSRASDPDKRVGTLVLTTEGELIQRLTIAVQPK
ncbi:MAG: nuclear transport factor 2 family protein [Planctomycetes bacterium]|nr:nuclear transport factor 2 family protein [Planctomycetota bacterium]